MSALDNMTRERLARVVAIVMGESSAGTVRFEASVDASGSRVLLKATRFGKSREFELEVHEVVERP